MLGYCTNYDAMYDQAYNANPVKDFVKGISALFEPCCEKITHRFFGYSGNIERALEQSQNLKSYNYSQVLQAKIF